MFFKVAEGPDPRSQTPGFQALLSPVPDCLHSSLLYLSEKPGRSWPVQLIIFRTHDKYFLQL